MPDKKKSPPKPNWPDVETQEQVDQRTFNAMIAGFQSLVAGWGIAITPAIRKFLIQAAQQRLNSQQFVIAFRKTKAYAKAFPGIRRKDGSLRMSEAQYMSGLNQAKDAAGRVGRNFNKEMYGLALSNHNSPSEIAAKIGAVDRLKTYGGELQEYNDYLLATGQIKKPLERKELLAFTMGQRKDLEKGWTAATAANRLEKMAGVDVGTDISHKELSGLIKRYESLGGDMEQVDYRRMGQLISDVIPKSQLYGMGITKRNIVNMMLDGEGAGEIAAKTQQILDTYEAAVTEPAAHGVAYQGQVQLGTPQSSSE